MTIAIDFDGVIHSYSRGWQGGEIYDLPVEGTREALTELRAKGWKIYIFSTRTNKIYHKNDRPPQEERMKIYLEEHGIPYDKIWSFGKPMADIYLDDRALNFRGKWVDSLQEIEQFQVWNRDASNPNG
jgi:hypothetical protein